MDDENLRFGREPSGDLAGQAGEAVNLFHKNVCGILYTAIGLGFGQGQATPEAALICDLIFRAMPSALFVQAMGRAHSVFSCLSVGLSIEHCVCAIGAGEFHRLNFVDVFGNDRVTRTYHRFTHLAKGFGPDRDPRRHLQHRRI
jgi:hypothetical protein